MTLSSSSNTINALGIFGRLEPRQEKYFLKLSEKYSRYPENNDAIGIFNHLSLVVNNNVEVGEIASHLDLLKKLKPHLPFRLTVSKPIIIDDKHIALSFDIKQTQKIRNLAKRTITGHVVETYYTKVVWYVPKNKQQEVMDILKNIKEMTFYDFKLCANRQDDQSTIYSSLKFK
ncbi:hypothetical protein ACFL0Y_02000 [Patescibacteria group bacterium]